MKYNTCLDRLVQLVATTQQNTTHVILSQLEFNTWWPHFANYVFPAAS